MYKFEIHLHTKACSACAVSDGIEMVDAAKAAGYSGIVITNHFYHGNTAVDRNLDWEDFVETYNKDYLATRNYGKKQGIQVFFGIEEGFAPGKEMLIYGISPKQLKEHPEFIMLGAKEKAELVHSLGGAVICAHPFRNRSYIPDPDAIPDMTMFDGIEMYNLGNDEQANLKAEFFVKENKIIPTSGGDVHVAKGFGYAGIAFETPIKSYKDFVKRLKKGDFSLIIPKE